MEDSTRRRLEKFEREQAFMADNAADFPMDSPGERATKKHTELINEMRALAGQQVSGFDSAALNVGNKADLLDDLLAAIRNMNRAANAFETEVPGSHLQFRLPRNRSQQNLLATARAFHTDSEPLEAKFVEYGLNEAFRKDLNDLIDAIDAAGSDADSGGERQAAATGGLLDAARRGMDNSRKLDAIVRIKYQNNPQRLAAWTVASHLDKAPKSKVITSPPG